LLIQEASFLILEFERWVVCWMLIISLRDKLAGVVWMDLEDPGREGQSAPANWLRHLVPPGDDSFCLIPDTATFFC
jgi:hypothetical protein